MKKKTKNKIQNIATKILSKIMLKEFPNLNIEKISKFWINFTEKTVNLIMLILTIIFFTIYLPKYYETNILIILLLIGIAFSLTELNKKLDPEDY